jgi:hypothetical protein
MLQSRPVLKIIFFGRKDGALIKFVKVPCSHLIPMDWKFLPKGWKRNKSRVKKKLKLKLKLK